MDTTPDEKEARPAIGQLSTLSDEFRLEDKRPERDYYVVTCKKCGARWSLKTTPTGGAGAGNILHLLDHAAGCAKPSPCF